ncbi:MAG: ribonuclease HII [Clostridiales bacterium]
MDKKIKIKDIKEKIDIMDIKEALSYLYFMKSNYKINLDKIIERYEKKMEKIKLEDVRLDKLMHFEKLAYKHNFNLVCGIDEAGRGPLAGPVVAAAVILPKNKKIYGVNDSKKLSPKKRDELYDVIVKEAVSYGVGIVDHIYIDRFNILNATKKAMKEAIGQLNKEPECLFIDSERLQDVKIKQKSIIKGDTLSISIAAASIIAKVTRDRIMCDYDDKYPEYGFEKHKGYGTKDHIESIKLNGLCSIHRISFTRKFV